MADEGYQNPSLKDELMARLERLRKLYGEKSIPKTIEYLVKEEELARGLKPLVTEIEG